MKGLLTLFHRKWLRPSYFADFTSQPDGRLPLNFKGATWQIIDGAAVNTPTLAGELLPDPSLEATYAAGQCSTLTVGFFPTLAESGDSHAGSKSQSFTPTGNSDFLNFPAVAGLVGTWFQASTWSKRTAGSASPGHTRLRLTQTGALPLATVDSPMSNATWAQNRVALLSVTLNNLLVYPAIYNNTSHDETQLLDEASLQAISNASLFALMKTRNANGTVKALLPGTFMSFADLTYFGLVLKASQQTDPTNFIFVLFRVFDGNTGYGKISVIKKIGSIYTLVMSETSTTILAAGAWLRADMTGSTLQVYYNDIQVGTDLTIADPELVNNSFSGLLSTGSNPITKFYAGSAVDKSLVWAGSSITAWTDSWSFRNTADTQLVANHPEFNFKIHSAAISGHNTWSNLVRLQRNIMTYAPNLVIFDTMNNTSASWNARVIEAFVRRIWTLNPETHILGWNFAQVQDPADNNGIFIPANHTDIAALESVLVHYGIPILDYWRTLRALVEAGHSLTEFFIDTTHPNQGGHAVAWGILVPFLLPLLVLSKPAELPERLYDSADFENPPTITPGTSYDSLTGTWTTSGTQVISSEVGATITYHATCTSYGLYQINFSNPPLGVSIDGGPSNTVQAYQNGIFIPAGRGPHTFTFEVLSNTVKIDEVWFI